jgi:multidrug efflux system membrane fusion protein
MAAVNSGLAVGERVVVDGTDRLRDGARVIVPGAKGQGSAAQGSTETGNPAPNAQPPNPDHQNRRKGGGQ